MLKVIALIFVGIVIAVASDIGLKKRYFKIYIDMESKYQRGQIYKIVDVGYNLCYVGSTCEKLSQRMVRHRIDYRNKKKKLSVAKIFDEYGVENCKIEWIEDCPCNSRKELLAREGHYIKNTECVNRNVVGRTDQEKKKHKFRTMQAMV